MVTGENISSSTDFETEVDRNLITNVSKTLPHEVEFLQVCSGSSGEIAVMPIPCNLKEVILGYLCSSHRSSHTVPLYKGSG